MNDLLLAPTSAPVLDPVREKLLGFLAAGTSQAAAALATGVTDGYVSQVIQEPEFMQALATLRAGRLDEYIKHDETIESLENKTLRVIEQKLPFVRSAIEAANIFKILNTARKQATPDGSANSSVGGTQQVNIVLPKAAQVAIQMNTLNQVIEISGRSMATLPSRSLPSLAAAAVAAKTAQADKDTARATELLENMQQSTMLGGVRRVL